MKTIQLSNYHHKNIQNESHKRANMDQVSKANNRCRNVEIRIKSKWSKGILVNQSRFFFYFIFCHTKYSLPKNTYQIHFCARQSVYLTLYRNKVLSFHWTAYDFLCDINKLKLMFLQRNKLVTNFSSRAISSTPLLSTNHIQIRDSLTFPWTVIITEGHSVSRWTNWLDREWWSTVESTTVPRWTSRPTTCCCTCWMPI